MRADLSIPAGTLGGSSLRSSIKVIATRSFGMNRVHLNAAAGLGRSDPAVPPEGVLRWWAGAAHAFAVAALMPRGRRTPAQTEGVDAHRH